MLGSDLPYARTYPLVRRLDFTTTERGYRTADELAEFLGLSAYGLTCLRICGGGQGYAPKWLRKSEGSIPAGVYRDADVAHWLIYGLSKLGQWWLAFYQHQYPSKAMKEEAKASARSLNEAYQLVKK